MNDELTQEEIRSQTQHWIDIFLSTDYWTHDFYYENQELLDWMCCNWVSYLEMIHGKGYSDLFINLSNSVVDWNAFASMIKKMPYGEFLTTLYWRVIRDEKLRTNVGCIECGCDPQCADFEIHHKYYIHHGYEHQHMLELNAICVECHERIHSNELLRLQHALIHVPRKYSTKIFYENNLKYCKHNNSDSTEYYINEKTNKVFYFQCVNKIDNHDEYLRLEDVWENDGTYIAFNV